MDTESTLSIDPKAVVSSIIEIDRELESTSECYPHDSKCLEEQMQRSIDLTTEKQKLIKKLIGTTKVARMLSEDEQDRDIKTKLLEKHNIIIDALEELVNVCNLTPKVLMSINKLQKVDIPRDDELTDLLKVYTQPDDTSISTDVVVLPNATSVPAVSLPSILPINMDTVEQLPLETEQTQPKTIDPSTTSGKDSTVPSTQYEQVSSDDENAVPAKRQKRDDDKKTTLSLKNRKRQRYSNIKKCSPAFTDMCRFVRQEDLDPHRWTRPMSAFYWTVMKDRLIQSKCVDFDDWWKQQCTDFHVDFEKHCETVWKPGLERFHLEHQKITNWISPDGTELDKDIIPVLGRLYKKSKQPSWVEYFMDEFPHVTGSLEQACK
jgi:hypothetical protein